MRFTLPTKGFEIPDEWWDAAGMRGFVAAADAYATAPAESHHADLPTDLVLIAEIAPPCRRVVLDASGFSRDRLISLLRGMRTGQPIPPVLIEAPAAEPSFRYSMVEGFHRFYASAAVGFRCLPCAIRPRFQFET